MTEKQSSYDEVIYKLLDDALSAISARFEFTDEYLKMINATLEKLEERNNE